jgi:hypothetical protein
VRTDDFEDRLRRALQDRADDITPDPAMWLRVRERHERGHRLRWAPAVATITPLVLIAVAVAVLEQPRPDEAALEQPTPVETSGLPDDEEAVAPSAPLVLASGDSVAVADARGRNVGTVVTGDEITAVRARPGDSTATATAAVLMGGTDCDGRLYVAGGGEDRDPWAAEFLQCPTAAVWSPGGLFLAFLEQASDGLHFSYTAWNTASGRPYGPGYVSPLVEGGDDLSNIRLHEWRWTDGPAQTPSGYLVFTATGDDGEAAAYQLPIRRLAADAFQVEATGPVEPLSVTETGQLAYADGAEAEISSEGPEYVVRMLDGEPVLEWSADGDRFGAVPLPGEVLDPAAPDGSRVWIRADGGTVLFGDGVDQAWRGIVDGDEFATLEPLRGEVQSADFLLPAGQQEVPPPVAPEATASPTASARPSPSPSVSASPSPTPSPSMPPTVAATRDALLAAAAARSFEQLGALLPADGEFSSNFGGRQDHIAFWQEEVANGVDVFGALTEVLSAPATLVDSGWVWPPEHADPDAGYLGYRVTIDVSGRWRAFVAGD